MLNKLPHALFLLFLLAPRAQAQASTISVTPLLVCDLTTFSCPGVSGCCTIAGCCGGGCCENGYTCINEGTADQACCPVTDPTKCGTVTASPSSGSDSGSGGNTCTTIDNCPADPDTGLGWTCLLGMTCGFSYRDCNPCPYIGSDSGSGGGSSPSSSSRSSPSSTSSPSSETSPSSPGSDSKSSGHGASEDRPRLYWLAVVGLGGALAIDI